MYVCLYVLGGEDVVDKLHTYMYIDNPGIFRFEVIMVVDRDGEELWWNGDGMIKNVLLYGSDNLS